MPNPENLIGRGFRENPQNINRKGRPKKWFTVLNERLSEQGEEMVTRKVLTEFLSLIFNLNERELRKIATQKDVPFAARLIINDLLSVEKSHQTWRDIRDFLFGGKIRTEKIKANIINLKQFRTNEPKF